MGTPRKHNVKPEAVNKPNDRLSIYKEQYYYELQRKDSLARELTLPVGIITFLIGAVTYFTGKLDKLHPSVPGALYVTLLLFIGVSILFAIYYLIRTNYGHYYEYVPTSRETENYYKQLEDYYKGLKQDSEIQPSFEKYLIDTYSKCNERNIMSNERKSAYLHNARTAIVIALISSVITLFACNVDMTEKMFKAIINNSNKEEVRNESKPGTSSATSTTISTDSTTNPRSQK